MPIERLNFKAYMVILAVMLSAFMEALDMTIVNVALPHLMNTFNVQSSTVTWLSTSYIISAAIVMPIASVLIERFGQKQLLLMCVIGFCLASITCGISKTFTEMVIARVFQGIFGAALVPVSLYILNVSFSKKLYSIVVALWGAGIVIAPILGPVLGGYLLVHIGWKAIFFINLPVCLVAAGLTVIFVSESCRHTKKIDWAGLLLMALAIGFMQLIIDRGGNLNWFNSKLIIYATIISSACFASYILRGIKLKDRNILDFGIFKNRNFSLCFFLICIFSGFFMGTNAIAPIFFQTLLNYNPFQSGLVYLPAGLATLFGIGCSAILIKFIDAKFLLAFGLLCCIYGSFSLSQANLNVSYGWLVKFNCIRELGLGVFFIVCMTIGLSKLSAKFAALGSGLLNFSRNLGGSIGISAASNSLNRHMQPHWHHLISQVTPYNANLSFWLTQQSLLPQASYNDPMALATISKIIATHSALSSFNSVGMLFSFLMVPVIVLILFLKSTKLDKLTTGA